MSLLRRLASTLLGHLDPCFYDYIAHDDPNGGPGWVERVRLLPLVQS